MSASAPPRIGILGAARITERALVAPARPGGHRLVAVAARARSRAEAFAAAHGGERTHGSSAGPLAAPEVEVLHDPLANGFHGPGNLAAIAAGTHIPTEEPPASDAAQAQEVRKAAALVDPLAAVTPSHPDQRFLVVGAEPA
ncbi:Oxidoreductase family, NAD-binding Rossmann fold [Streptomyces sp. di188]|nr:Oxidoreductase family, NAD-binding Rossmann fold [Streptomyces sp. di50b]SCE35968.1 Oxidoreductase family, NAD-binding Rossmann fold [Streptomyces sp. di188]